MKIIGLSVDALDNHEAWAKDIEDTQGTAPNYPIISDSDFNVSKLYGMLPASTSGDPRTRTPADNQTVRNVFVIGPDKKVKLILVYPMTTGRNFDEVLRVIDSLQLTAKHKVATPVNWKHGREGDHRRLGLKRRGQRDLPGRVGGAASLHPDRAAAELAGPAVPAYRGRRRCRSRPGWSLAGRRPSSREAGAAKLLSCSSRFSRIRAVAPQMRCSSTT